MPRQRRTPVGSPGGARDRAGTATNRLERRQHILAAARDVFARRGYHDATIDDIVAEAGVARGTFYLYFADKRAVFSDLVDRFSARISVAIQRIDPDDRTRTVAEQTRANIRAILGVCLAERALAKILLADAVGSDAGFERRLNTFFDEAIQLLSESLRDGQALGIVRDGEPRVLSYLTIGALKELLLQAVTLGLAEESADALAAQVFAFLAEGCLRVDATPFARRRRS
ncbi:MAG TPA: TetR/AcrR family transcriptional regulator [Polyangiaceae bacterium]|nr:TetR/AcrR family transcriptional regulator [Polyangiaceae bacterium]